MIQDLPDNICKFGATAEELQQYEYLTDSQKLTLIIRHRVHTTLEKIKKICGYDNVAIKRCYSSIYKHYKNNFHEYSTSLFLHRLDLAFNDYLISECYSGRFLFKRYGYKYNFINGKEIITKINS